FSRGGEGAEPREEVFLTPGLTIKGGAEFLHGGEEGVGRLLHLVSAGAGDGGCGTNRTDYGNRGFFGAGTNERRRANLLLAVTLIVHKCGLRPANPALHTLNQPHTVPHEETFSIDINYTLLPMGARTL